ncbi:MAG: hypothetical protein QHJ82_14795 [Verrucomicrobiota bacterium]|nr:hypothetical protein [Verrucomicrobiota bacterium]
MPRSYALNITSLNPAEHDESEPALAGDSQFSIGSGSRTSQSLTGYRWYSPGGRLWQLDGMSFQVKNGTPWLFLVGGYDFQNKGAIDSVYGPNRYGGGKPGDLFIWYGQGTAPKNKGLHTPGTLGNAGLGYAYAVAIGDLITGGNLTVYDLNEDTLIDLTRGDGPFRDPWRVKPLKRNLAVDAAFFTLAEYYVGLTSGQVSEITGDEYPHVDTGFSLARAVDLRKSKHRQTRKFNVLGIDLSFLFRGTNPDDTIWFEFTNQRGEPVLAGSMPAGLPVADGGFAVALLGFSLFVLRVVRRWRR